MKLQRSQITLKICDYIEHHFRTLHRLRINLLQEEPEVTLNCVRQQQGFKLLFSPPTQFSFSTSYGTHKATSLLGTGGSISETKETWG
jgi:hypothetical protein